MLRLTHLVKPMLCIVRAYNYKHQHGPIDNKLKYISCGCLLNALSIDSPACLKKIRIKCPITNKELTEINMRHDQRLKATRFLNSLEHE